MLKQRVITALVLLAILLPALLHPNTLGFNAIVLVMVSAGAWEWGRLNLVGPVATWASVAGVAAVAGLAWQQGWLAASYPLLWWAVGGAWVLAASFLVRHGVPVWARIALWLRWPLGLLALLAAGLAMVQARGMGINFLLSVLLLVWMADIAAYFRPCFGATVYQSQTRPQHQPRQKLGRGPGRRRGGDAHGRAVGAVRCPAAARFTQPV